MSQQSNARSIAEGSLRSLQQDLQASEERARRVRELKDEGGPTQSRSTKRLQDLPEKGRYLDIRV